MPAYVRKFDPKRRGSNIVPVSETPATHVGSNPVGDSERFAHYISDRATYYSRVGFTDLSPETEGVSLLTTLWGEEGEKQDAILVTRGIATYFPDESEFFDEMEVAINNY